MIGIYKITNLTNNKVYIGQSRNIQQRFATHRSRAFNQNSEDYNKYLYRAIRKYGLDNFSFEVIEQCSIEQLNEKEKYWIIYYNAENSDFGYNQTLEDFSIASQKMTPQILNDIIFDLKNTDTPIKDIAEKYGFHSNMITNINQGHSWRKDDMIYPIRTYKFKRCSKCGKIISSGAKSYCIECGHLMQRKVDRPSREELKNKIRTLPFTQIGKKYGVSDNTIRKWCKTENLPTSKKEINSYSDLDWNKI